jgi:amino acid permease
VEYIKPWHPVFAWIALVIASLGLLLSFYNLFVNTGNVGSWLPLLLIMPFTLAYAIVSLRVRSRRKRSR